MWGFSSDILYITTEHICNEINFLKNASDAIFNIDIEIKVSTKRILLFPWRNERERKN